MMATAKAKPTLTLLVEDSPIDVKMTRAALEGRPRHHQLSVANDGQHALAYLRGEGAYAGSERPDLVLLDLNLPRLDGHGVLAAIRSHPELRLLPVVVLTSSQSTEDIRLAYEGGANCYVTKPADVDEFLSAVRIVHEFWCDTVSRSPA